MKREFEDEGEVDIRSGFEVRIATAISFDSDGEIETEMKSYLKTGCLKFKNWEVLSNDIWKIGD